MSSLGRVRAEFVASWHSFLRRRTAVFFTFFFPVIIVLIFGALVQTQPTGGGLFAEPPAYYVPGYLAVVVLFTPLSRVGSTIARHREGNRFEKLATTPLSRPEWLLAQTLVNVVVIGLAALLLFALTVLVTGVSLPTNAAAALVVPLFVALGVTLFCGLGAILGRVADSQDGVIAASNAVALPLLFLSETFVTPDLLPAWFRPAIDFSPLTYFARGVRAVTTGTGDPWTNLAVLAVLAAAFFAVGAASIPRTD
ncbi:ABC-2 type transport system permease protein [Halogeometricum rufum]|uniref:ABC-2 type transport system permease protein n=1 Tax=Halogeometricum rufum TaxID=553469 RepID=A0A1I6GMS6_9EURY|nr:ABC transporter permease [Halogeometricum rufum]SFR43429.1 ABC-2 type transport system permease protein [Halogeometricum rufum]